MSKSARVLILLVSFLLHGQASAQTGPPVLPLPGGPSPPVQMGICLGQHRAICATHHVLTNIFLAARMPTMQLALLALRLDV
jgi:hypothetical protein